MNIDDRPTSGFEPCTHAVPQADSCLHGICIFCYRDRLAQVTAERDRLRDDRNLEKRMRQDAGELREDALAATAPAP